MSALGSAAAGAVTAAVSVGDVVAAVVGAVVGGDVTATVDGVTAAMGGPPSTLEPFAYTACLLFSMVGMLVLDWRHRLFWFADWKRAAIVHTAGVAAFLVWDGFGIGLGVFFRGETPYMTGLLLAPELPVEELLFLTFLCWLTMNVYTGTRRILLRRAAQVDEAQGDTAERDTAQGDTACPPRREDQSV